MDNGIHDLYSVDKFQNPSHTESHSEPWNRRTHLGRESRESIRLENFPYFHINRASRGGTAVRKKKPGEQVGLETRKNLPSER